MNLPKVKFIDMPLFAEANMIRWFLPQDSWGWGKYIIKIHPELKSALSLENEKEQISFIKKYIIQFRKNNAETIRKNKKRYEKEWHKIEKVSFQTLSEICETKWPKNRKTIYAMMSINPVCPRFLNTWSFSVFYNYRKTESLREVVAHECCHFLYFKKWKELFPKMDHKKFNAPHIEWHLSEIVAPIILNDTRMQKLLKQKASFYPEHTKLKISGKPVPQYFTALYKKNIKEKKGFDAFLKQAYREIKNKKM